MSEYCHVELELRDRAMLVEALKLMDFQESKIEVHDEAQALYGFQGDLRTEKAHVIIRRKHIGPYANDIGFVKNEVTGQFTAIVSEFERSSGYGDEWTKKLLMAYGEVGWRRFAKQGMMQVKEKTVRQDGATVLRLHW